MGRQIRKLRKQRGLTQRELAKALYCSPRWISEVEQGKDTAQIGKLITLCQFLGAQLQLRLLGESDKTATAPSDYPDLETIMGGAKS